MNKIAKVLGNAAVAAVVVMNAEAIEVKKFSAKVYEAADMEEITKKDPFLTVAIKVFQDSYRAHIDELRGKENPSDLLRADNYKYFLTLYDVIVTEMAKMVFNIEAIGDSVNYAKANKDTIIECISGEGNTYKSIDSYSESNWNYLLLINVLNQVKHSTQKIDEKLIQTTADMIAQQEKYSKYTTQLNNAVYDIKKYFDELDLYEYLTEVRNSLTVQLADEIVDVQNTGKRMSYINLEISIKTKVVNEAEYYAVFIGRNGEQASKFIEYSVKGKEITTYHLYEFDEDTLNIIKPDIPKQIIRQVIQIPEINGKSWIKMKHIMEEVKNAPKNYYETQEEIVGPYRKAETQDLVQDEKNFTRFN